MKVAYQWDFSRLITAFEKQALYEAATGGKYRLRESLSHGDQFRGGRRQDAARLARHFGPGPRM